MRTIQLAVLVVTFVTSTLAAYNCYCQDAPDDSATHRCCNGQNAVISSNIYFDAGGWGLCLTNDDAIDPEIFTRCCELYRTGGAICYL